MGDPVPASSIRWLFHQYGPRNGTAPQGGIPGFPPFSHTQKTVGPRRLPPSKFHQTFIPYILPVHKFFHHFEIPQIYDNYCHAIISLIAKLPCKTDLNLLRPIRLTCGVCKALETVLEEKMFCHLFLFSLLISQKHAFKPRHSTLTNVLVVEESFNEMAWRRKCSKFHSLLLFQSPCLCYLVRPCPTS